MSALPPVHATLFKNTYEVRDGELLLRVLGRDTEGGRVERLLTGTEPYLYLLEEDVQRTDPKMLPGGDGAKVVDVRPGPSTVGGRPTCRVTVRYPFDVPSVRRYYPYHAEADLVYPLRTRVDYGLTHVALPSPDGSSRLPVSRVRTLESDPLVRERVLHFDIETRDAGGFAKPADPYQPVLSIAFRDTYREPYGIIYVGPPVDPEAVSAVLRDNIPGFDSPIRLFPVGSEHDLIGSFGELLAKVEPDLCSAYNGYGYDYPYLSQRTGRLMSADPGSADLRRVFDSFDIDRPLEKYHGVQGNRGRYALFDPLVAYRKLKSKQGSYSLEAVAQEVLGYGKLKRPELVSELRDRDLVRFLGYNLVDVVLIDRIDAKKRLVKFFRGMAEVSNVEIPDVVHNSRIVDGALLTEARLADGAPEFALPSKNMGSSSAGGFTGALVLPPVLGLHEWAVVFDFSQDYPGIIESLNISFETRADPALPPEETYRLSYDGRPGGVYRRSPPGLLPRAVHRMRLVRNAAKEEEKRHPVGSPARLDSHMRSFSIKTVVNSFYGVIGSSTWRLSDPSMAGDVTGVGRELIRWNVALVENPEWMLRTTGVPVVGRVLQGDTDSVFIQFHHADGSILTGLDAVLPVARAVRDGLNASYGEFFRRFGAESHLAEVDLEAVYEVLRILPLSGDEDRAAKKRYFGLYAWEGGRDVRGEPVESRIKYSGLEIKRWNNAAETVTVQKELVRLTVARAPLSEVAEYLDSEREAALRGKRDDALLIPTKLSKALSLYGRARRKKMGEDGVEHVEVREVRKPEYVRAVENYSNLTGRVVGTDEDFHWAYVRGPVSFHGKVLEEPGEFALPYRTTLAEAAEAGFGLTIDRERMVRKVVDDPARLVVPETEGSVGNMEDGY